MALLGQLLIGEGLGHRLEQLQGQLLRLAAFLGGFSVVLVATATPIRGSGAGADGADAIAAWLQDGPWLALLIFIFRAASESARLYFDTGRSGSTCHF